MKTDTSKLFNIANYLPEMAAKIPNQKAVVYPLKKKGNEKRRYSHLTFHELNVACDKYCHAFKSEGITREMKVLLMVKPSLEFIALTFALFKIGAVPILIDPGMGKKRLLECIQGVTPDAIVAIPLAHIIRRLMPKYFKSVSINIVVGKHIPLLGKNIDLKQLHTREPFDIVDTTRSSPAAILFTSGSTGPAKGVLYEHGMFDAQVQLLKKQYDFRPGEVDLAGLPVFALFDVAMGMTCVVPDMNPTKPAEVNPENIIEAINDHRVTTSFGSPAIWKNVAEHCLKANIELPSVERILMAGAPVPVELIRKFQEILPYGDVHTPYGATESLPASSISGKTILELMDKSTNHFGTCVGHSVAGVTIRIIKISDRAIPALSDNHILPNNEIGEIIVNGPSVTKQYYNKEIPTKLAKIYEGDKIWHRIGDIGYLDDDNKLWFLGRKNHRITSTDKTHFTVPCEIVFNKHPKVYRSALVGIGEVGKQKPIVIIEPHKDDFPKTSKQKKDFSKELLTLSSPFSHCKDIKQVLFHHSFPVDIRHNAKIFREKLSIWANRKINL